MQWDPRKYSEFADHRARPFFDLVGRIDAGRPRHVVDLGCGPGNLTAVLAARWPQAQVLGIDSSPSMIARAAADQQARNLRFAEGDLRTWDPAGDVDIVVSNAALQWVPEHRDLLRRWLGLLRPGAWLAFQVPGNFGAPSHALMRELAGSERWLTRLSGVLRHKDAVSEPADYLQLLLDGGWTADVWETTYLQRLDGPDPVLEWVRGTALRPVLEALDPAEAAEFEVEYRTLLRRAYPAAEHGTVFPFRRIFAVGRRPEA
jgi:trans-aconitate 2-methyltransferase